MQSVVSYIMRFILDYNEENVISFVSYGADSSAKLVIEPSGFFDDGIYLTERSLPSLPLQEWDGVPILFGEPKVWEERGQIHIGADLVASAFFLLSRYEECVRRDVRDQYGRFIGKESLPYRAGFINRPVIEEYGVLLRRYLRCAGVMVSEPEEGFSHIWLTHDVDEIWTWDNLYRAARTMVKRVLTNQPRKLQSFLSVLNYKKHDPVYTFPWLIEQDDSVRAVYGAERSTPLYFLMGCTKKQGVDQGYWSNQLRTTELVQRLQKGKCMLGCHISYTAAREQAETGVELSRIRALTKEPIRYSRNHFLASREPEDFCVLLENGITDDFTMGYADVVGFRLGTCRPVRWLDPVRREVSDLQLHPMTVMECTLDNENYMGIADEETAFSIVKGLLQQIYTYNGEVVLLWHSPSVYPKPNSYQRSLYVKTLQFLRELKRESIAE